MRQLYILFIVFSVFLDSCSGRNSKYPKEVSKTEYDEIMSPIRHDKVQIPDDYVPNIPITNELREIDIARIFYEEGYNAGRNPKPKTYKIQSTAEIRQTRNKNLARIGIPTKWYPDTILLVKAFYMERPSDFVYYNSDYIQAKSSLGYDKGLAEREALLNDRRAEYLH